MTTLDLLLTAITILARWQRTPDCPRRDYEGVSWLVEHPEPDDPLSAEEVKEQKDILRALDPATFKRMFPTEEAGPS